MTATTENVLEMGKTFMIIMIVSGDYFVCYIIFYEITIKSLMTINYRRSYTFISAVVSFKS